MMPDPGRLRVEAATTEPADLLADMDRVQALPGVISTVLEFGIEFAQHSGWHMHGPEDQKAREGVRVSRTTAQSSARRRPSGNDTS